MSNAEKYKLAKEIIFWANVIKNHGVNPKFGCIDKTHQDVTERKARGEFKGYGRKIRV